MHNTGLLRYFTIFLQGPVVDLFYHLFLKVPQEVCEHVVVFTTSITVNVLTQAGHPQPVNVAIGQVYKTHNSINSKLSNNTFLLHMKKENSL